MAGRKPLPGQVDIVRVKLRLREGEDDDLRAFFADIPTGKRASAVKMALRSGGLQSVQSVAAQDEADLTAATDDFLV